MNKQEFIVLGGILLLVQAAVSSEWSPLFHQAQGDLDAPFVNVEHRASVMMFWESKEQQNQLSGMADDFKFCWVDGNHQKNVNRPFSMPHGRLTAAHLTLHRMSVTSPNPPDIFSPFHAILQDGIDRLLELVPTERFTFIMKGYYLKTTWSEAVLISPIIAERLKTDPTNR
jgi:hypothetical protein